MLRGQGNLVQSSHDARDGRRNLPSFLNRVDREMLDANNASFPHLPVLQQWVELYNDHCLHGVHSIGDHHLPTYLVTAGDGLGLENLQNGAPRGRPGAPF